MKENASSIKIIKPSLKKKLKRGSFLIIGSLIFVLGGFWIVVSGKDIIIGIACILFFGFTFVSSVKKYILRGIHRIDITEEGIRTIFSPVEKEIFIPWNAINDVWVQSFVTKTNIITTKNQNLHFSLKNPGQFIDLEDLKRKNIFLRKTSQLVVSEEELEKFEQTMYPSQKPYLSLGDDYEISLEELASIIKSKIKVGT